MSDAEFMDIVYTAEAGVATITINRPEVMNAFRGRTCEELIEAFQRAGWDKNVAVIVLTGAGGSGIRGPQRRDGRRRAGRMPRNCDSDH